MNDVIRSRLFAGANNDMFGYYRSKTVPPPIDQNTTFRGIKSSATLELERRAKVEAERAAKVSRSLSDEPKWRPNALPWSVGAGAASQSGGRTHFPSS